MFNALAAGLESRVEVHRWPAVRSHGDITFVAERSTEDVGLIERQRGQFLWRLSRTGWADFAEKVLTLQDVPAGHQYLDGPTDNLQVIVAVGEYGERWWTHHAG